MEPLKFCTEPFPPRDQKEVWSEWFQPDFDVYPEETDEPAFKAQYVIWRLGDVSLTWTSAPATRSVRAPSHLRHSPIDHWVITYCRGGATRLSTKDGQLDAHAGLPFVWSLGHVSDSRRTAAQRLQLYLPRDSFSRIGPCLDNAASSALDTPMGHLLAEYMCLLQRNAKGLAYEDAVRLRDAVEAMVAACFLPSAERLATASPQIELTRMERVRRAVRRNLRSPSLGPDKLCREAAMSRSKLYRLLEGEAHRHDRAVAVLGELLQRLLALRVVRDLEIAIVDAGFLLEFLGAVIGGFVEGFVELAAEIVDDGGLDVGGERRKGHCGSGHEAED